MKRLSVFLILVLLPLSVVWGERMIPHGQPIDVRLAHDQFTLVQLPEMIHGVFAVVDPGILSVTYGGPMVAIKAQVPDLRGRLVAIGQSGKRYKITYQVKEPNDDEIIVLSEQHQAGLTKPATTSPTGKLDLPTFVRAFRTGTSLPGQQPLDLPAPQIPDERLQIVAWQSVQATPYVGLVLTVRNATDAPLAMDIRYGEPAHDPASGVVKVAQWSFPPQHTVRAITADRDRLMAGESVQIYVVLERR